MSGLCLLPTVQSFVPSISLLPGEPHIAPLYHCMLQAATPLSILHKWTPSVQRLCIRKKFIFRTTLKIGPGYPFWPSTNCSLFMTSPILIFTSSLTVSGNINVLGVGSGPNIQDFVSGDNINQAWYGHAENSCHIWLILTPQRGLIELLCAILRQPCWHSQAVAEV